MSDTMLNLRRLFRNRFEHYMGTGTHAASVELDGSPLTLLDLCEKLDDDLEPAPRYYDRDLIKLCGHEARLWFRGERNYGDMARLTAKHVSLSSKGLLHRAGIWVAPLLESSGSIDAPVTACQSGDDGDHEIELDYVVRQNEREPFL